MLPSRLPALRARVFHLLPGEDATIAILANATCAFGRRRPARAARVLVTLLFPAGRRGPSTFVQRPATAHRRISAALVLCYFLLFLKLPLEAAYLLPALPFPAAAGRQAPQSSFRAFCLALLISPFLFAFRGAMTPPSPALFRVRCPIISTFLLGRSAVDQAQCRRRQPAICRHSGSFPRPPLPRGGRGLEYADDRPTCSTTTVRRTAHCAGAHRSASPLVSEKSFHGEDPHGLVEFRCLLTPRQFFVLQREGKTIYCVPDMQNTLRARLGFDPFTHGCRIAPLPWFNHD